MRSVSRSTVIILVGALLLILNCKNLPGDEVDCEPAEPCDGSQTIDNQGDVEDLLMCSSVEHLTIFSCDDVYSIDLPCLEALVGDDEQLGCLMIIDNTALQTIELPALMALDGSLIVRNNDLLEYIHVANLATVGEAVQITSNSSMANLEGLVRLEFVGREIVITHNNSMTNFQGMSNLTVVGGAFEISQNDSLMDFDGLRSLETVGDLSVRLSEGLRNLDGLSHLKTIHGNLTIQSNYNLAGLDGPSGLTAIGGDMDISYHDSLTSLSGLSNLSTVGGNLTIFCNEDLPPSEASAFVDSVEVGGHVDVSGNGGESCDDDDSDW